MVFDENATDGFRLVPIFTSTDEPAVHPEASSRAITWTTPVPLASHSTSTLVSAGLPPETIFPAPDIDQMYVVPALPATE